MIDSNSDSKDFSSDVQSRTSSPRILIVAGEASSDLHAASLVRELRLREPGAKVFGMGGSALRSVGVETIVNSEHTASVMGITEVFRSLSKLYQAFQSLIRSAVERKAELAILVDFPDFNLRLAKRLRRAGIPVLYYISPQLWAWRSGRVRQMKRNVRKVAAIFPFEESFYHRHGVDAEYVGHPLAQAIDETISFDELSRKLELGGRQTIIALLPGSRQAEISQLFPVMLEAAERLTRYRPDIAFVTPVAPGVTVELLKEIGGERAKRIHFYQGPARDVLSHATATVVASGTATVETALAGSPMLVVYRLSALTYRIARLLVRGVKHFAMPNLIAGEAIVPELLQDEVTGVRIAQELELLLGDPQRLLQQRQRLGAVKDRLKFSGQLSAPARAAEIALSMVEDCRAGSTSGRGTLSNRDRFLSVEPSSGGTERSSASSR